MVGPSCIRSGIFTLGREKADEPGLHDRWPGRACDQAVAAVGRLLLPGQAQGSLQAMIDTFASIGQAVIEKQCLVFFRVDL